MSSSENQTDMAAPSTPPIGQRLRELREALGLTQEALAVPMGTRAPVISRYERGRRVPDAAWLIRLGKAYPAANVSRIVTGAGPVLLPEGEQAVVDGPEVYRGSGPVTDDDLLVELRRRLAERKPGEGPIVWTAARRQMEGADDREAYTAVPYMADAAAAGDGAVIEDDQVAGYVLIHRRVAPDPTRLRCVRISGESMAPALTDGSIVAFDVTRTDPREANGQVVIARTGEGEVVVKRWRQNSMHVLLYSDNPDQRRYPPIVLEPHLVGAGALRGIGIWAWVDLR